MSSPLEKLTEEIREVALLVHSAQERSEDREIVKNAHIAVERVSQNYRELTSNGTEAEKDKVERTLGRRVTDLRRLASMLPRIGSLANGHTGDQVSTTPSEVGHRRVTGVSWQSTKLSMDDFAIKHKVGGEVDSWCGPCDSLTTHHIVAMVGTDPKQVVCQACGGRHGYRLAPARKPATATDGDSAPAMTEAGRKAEQKAEEQRTLSHELASAETVRPFDSRERYKVGEYISHPSYGRGKVENVLRSSILVRFSGSGLKSLMLN